MKNAVNERKQEMEMTAFAMETMINWGTNQIVSVNRKAGTDDTFVLKIETTSADEARRIGRAIREVIEGKLFVAI